jgi:hypothetical protein
MCLAKQAFTCDKFFGRIGTLADLLLRRGQAKSEK